MTAVAAALVVGGAATVWMGLIYFSLHHRSRPAGLEAALPWSFLVCGFLIIAIGLLSQE